MHVVAEPVESQRRGVDAIQPDRTGMSDLRLERERLLVHQQPVPGGRVSVSAFEFLEQVGRNRPAVFARRAGEAKAFELAHSWRDALGVRRGRALDRVDAVAFAGDICDVPVHGTDRGYRLGGERDEVAGSQALRGAGVVGRYPSGRAHS
jgi:hypothetical protein